MFPKCTRRYSFYYFLWLYAASKGHQGNDDLQHLLFTIINTPIITLTPSQHEQQVLQAKKPHVNHYQLNKYNNALFENPVSVCSEAACKAPTVTLSIYSYTLTHFPKCARRSVSMWGSRAEDRSCIASDLKRKKLSGNQIHREKLERLHVTETTYFPIFNSSRMVCMLICVCPTSQHAECYGLRVFSQQIGLGDGSQGEITGHVPAQLPVPSLQEPHRYRDGQHHDRRAAVVLRRPRERGGLRRRQQSFSC